MAVAATRNSLFGCAKRFLSTTVACCSQLKDHMDETFYFKDLITERAKPSQLQSKPDADNLLFGHHFSDHMFEVEWSAETGWSKPKICPLHYLSLHPGAKVLHYAIELFEGLKAYRGVDNKIRIFRPDLNMTRMVRSAKRACLPAFEGEELIQCIEEMVRLDQEWVPYSTTSTLYIRPCMIGTDKTLGVGWSHSALLFVATGPTGTYFPQGFKPVSLYATPTVHRSMPGGVGEYKMGSHYGIGVSNEAQIFMFSGPVGAYFPGGWKPVSLLANPSLVRAWPGGAGNAKLGCNYAPTILIGKQAAEQGCQQVLWLYDDDEKLTEVGTMNIFVYWINDDGEKELVTPPLTDGIILPGVTRQTLLDLAREWGEFKVSEHYPTMNCLRRAIKQNRLLEMFGSGTACIVAPVDHILYVNGDHKEDLYIPTMEQNPCLMQRLFDCITDIQYGRIAKPGWTRTVVE